MKKILFGALVVLLATSCNQEEIKRLTFQRDSIQQVKDQTEAQMNDYLSTIMEVQSNIKNIKETQMGIIEDMNGAEGVTSESKANIQNSFRSISDYIENSKKQIDQLEADLASAKQSAASFKGIVASLRKDLKESTAKIADLQSQLEEKNIKIAELDRAVEALNAMKDSLNNVSFTQAAAIKAQDEELNTAWYIIGTKKDLKAKGLKEGDLRTARINKSIFTKVDIREFDGLDLGSKKAKLYTSHPESAYSLDKKSATEKTLVFKIKDYSLFWSSSKILVIQID